DTSAVIRLGLSRMAGLAGGQIDGQTLFLRPPRDSDWSDWAAVRAASRGFLVPWEPTWPADSLSRAAFRRRIRVIGAEWREDSAILSSSSAARARSWSAA